MKTRHPAHRGPSSRFVDPKVLARVDNLDLLARTVVEGFIGGLHRSPYRGLSVDFAEHRPYLPGDDIRLIDWKVWARTDRLYIKQFEADSNANFHVLVDVSRSMDFAADGISKLDYARYLAACLTVFASKQRDRVGLLSFDDEVVDYIPASAKHVDLILHTLDRIRSGGESSLERPLWKLAEATRRSGIMVLISDLYEEPGAVLQAVQRLGHRGHDLIVFHVLDRAEIDFDFEAAAEYRDLETGERMPVVPDNLREEYRELVQEHVAALTRSLGANRVDYALFDTSMPLDHALFAYLSMRQRITRMR